MVNARNDCYLYRRKKYSIRRNVSFGTLCLLGALLVSFSCNRSRPIKQVVNIYTASSLAEVFRDLEQSFERNNPNTNVVLVFAGSQVLRLQIEQGAKADIFASANKLHIDALGDSQKIRDSQVFAHGELSVIVPLDNPKQIHSFADLIQSTRLVVGNQNVPVGIYFREVLRRGASQFGLNFEATILSNVVSEENNVRLVRAKVELGEADAGIVYHTDALLSERVRSIRIPTGINVRTDYLIGVVNDSENQALADRWVMFVLSQEGKTILSDHGFIIEP